MDDILVLLYLNIYIGLCTQYVNENNKIKQTRVSCRFQLVEFNEASILPDPQLYNLNRFVN